MSDTLAFCNAAGVFTAYRKSGSGPAMLLLHGNPDTGALWEGVAPRLSQRFTCLVPDLPGFGKSEAPPSFTATLPEMAVFVEAFLNAAGAEGPVHLAVHDFGGPYGLSWACEHPERVATITCINTVFHASYHWHFWARVWRTPLLGELAMKATSFPLFFLELKRGSRKLSRQAIRRMYDNFTPATRRMVLTHYRATDPWTFSGSELRFAELARKVPVQVLWGEHDPYIPKEYAGRFGARKIVFFPDCGHFLPSEAPEEVAREVESFARSL
ncbi:MAG: alpha/beta hydrolase [Thermodesulfobacteriota bacterium]